MGAAQYVAVERFHWDNRPEFRRQIVQYLLDSLQPAQRARIDGVWQTYVEDPLKSKDGPLQYVVMPFEDFPGTGGPFDVIWSRVVLQSVLDLDAVFGKIAQCLCPDGLSIHKTDLGHEGHSHSGHPLSFLSYSPRLWRAMYSHRDSLNRLRKSDYFAAAQRAGMEMARVEVTRELDPSIVEAIRPRLLPAFRTKDTADLACQGLLLAMRHKSARMSPK
jgi:SAM-dependent methyltransferase